ncbi:PRD1 [Candida theae]|uniref:PRD1 n=1 Tax=Candida theae TaxID=1198502 RepID=A0AAD5BDD5_9ASCO|nr:PRD1 [Candida theae]KAI5954788.1 PRD1 [Candida theae]
MSIDFDKLVKEQHYPQWNQTPEEVLKLANDYALQEKQLFDTIASVEEPTVENVLNPFTKFYNEVEFPINQITFYQHVSADKKLRDASTEAEQILDQNSIEQWSRYDVYSVLKSLKDKKLDLDPESQRFLDKTVLEFERKGLALTDAKREKVKKLQVELSDLKVKFAKNLGEDTGCVYLTKEELEGVPEVVLKQYEEVESEGQTKLKVTFKYPDIIPLFQHASKGETRKIANIAYGTRCSANEEILTKIIKLRFQIAKELGYNTFADFALEVKLAKSKDTVLNFLNDLRDKLTPVGESELQVLKDLKSKDLEARGLAPEKEFYSWDFAYYDQRLLEQKYQVDSLKISEYFPLQSTIKKMLGFYETIMDAKFVKLSPKPTEVWHEDVEMYAVFKNIKFGTLEYVGVIYFDLHPREGKYGHAANFGIGPGYLNQNGTRKNPETVLVCNFTKPTKTTPSLLKHNEVVTFFHELGHGIHNMLSQTKYAKFHGTNVEYDFVEAPSQMLEYWVWSKNEIRSLSSHHETGKPISDDLIDSLIKTKHVNTGLSNLRQLFFGLFDMSVHSIESEEEIAKLDLFKTWNTLRRDVTLLPDGNNPTKGYCSFGHIAGGYEAGYYGYLYSQVFAADIYYTLFKEDPMNTENGIRYRDIVLKRGGSREIMDNLEEVLGRKPNSEAFLSEIFGKTSHL